MNANDAPRWLPIASRLAAHGQPFTPVNTPAHSIALPFHLDPSHAHLPHWTAANEAAYEPSHDMPHPNTPVPNAPQPQRTPTPPLHTRVGPHGQERPQ